MYTHNLGFKTSNEALEAYKVQNKIVVQNLELFGNSDLVKDLQMAKDAGVIYSGNIKRLTEIGEAYSCLRIMELTKGAENVRSN